MKNLKLSFALVIAVLAVGATVAANANVFGKRVITRCFTQISLKNIAGATASLDASQSIACATAKSQVSLTPYLTAGDVETSLASEDACVLPAVVFCCANVTEINSSDPGYASTPFIDLGEGLRKYKIASQNDVFCKVQ